MKAYTSSNSSSAMSVARVALGRSTTSLDRDGATDSPGRWGPTVMKVLREQVPAEKVGGVRAPQVRPRVDDHIPGAVGGRVHRAWDRCGHVRVALGVGYDLLEGDGDIPALRAVADVDVRDVRRESLQSVDDNLDRDALRRGSRRDTQRTRSGRVDPVELETEATRCRRSARAGAYDRRRVSPARYAPS